MLKHIYDIFMAVGSILAFLVVCAIVTLLIVKPELEKGYLKISIIATTICALLAAGCFIGAHNTAPHCPNCGTFAYFSYCEQCGEPVNIKPTCPSCGEECNTPFCGNCGTPMAH